MNMLRSKYVNNPVVAAIIIVGAGIIMMELNERPDSGFPESESRVIKTFCDVVSFPLSLLEWAGLGGHPKSRVLQVGKIVFGLVMLVGTWTAIIYGARAMLWRIRHPNK